MLAHETCQEWQSAGVGEVVPVVVFGIVASLADVSDRAVAAAITAAGRVLPEGPRRVAGWPGRYGGYGNA
jgi:hypothetical protein